MSTNAMLNPTTIVRREGWNPRFDFGEIDLLAKSIKVELDKNPEGGGLINDIRVRVVGDGTSGQYELIDGDRRLTAVQSLMKKGVDFPYGIPAKVEGSDITDLDSLIRMFTANTGKPFLPLEEADAFKRMREAKMTLPMISKATGRSHQHIAESFALLDADDEVKAAVRDKSVGVNTAKKIAVHARGDKTKQKQLLAAAKTAKGKSQKKALATAIDDSRRAKAEKAGRKLKMRALTDDQLSAIGAKMSEQLSMLMEKLGLPADADLEAWVAKNDDEVRTAFAFGVLQSLKAAAGLPVKLVL